MKNYKSINYNEYQKVVKEIEELSRIKNKDYGCDSLIRYGNFGILVRMSDKLDRLTNLYKNGQIPAVASEKIEDTLKDIVNYALYAILQERGVLVESELETQVKQGILIPMSDEEWQKHCEWHKEQQRLYLEKKQKGG